MFLHVFGQISFLSVRLATEVADVRFQVFRFLVLWDMVKKTCLVREAFVATVTFEWLVSLVRTGM